MSKMKDLYQDQIESEYERYQDSVADQLRSEGAEELRKDILRILEEMIQEVRDRQKITSNLNAPDEWYKQGLYSGTVAAQRASIK